jgi:hypothetical protein
MSGRTKGEIVDEIARMLGVPTPPMSTGSTEPKAIFELVNRELGLGLGPGLGKAELAKAIVGAAGFDWSPDCESRGATVTTTGLEAVAAAVRLFLE